MKTVSFLRNTWKRKDKSHHASGEASPVKDGFWDVSDKSATYPVKKSITADARSHTLPRNGAPAPALRAVASQDFKPTGNVRAAPLPVERLSRKGGSSGQHRHHESAHTPSPSVVKPKPEGRQRAQSFGAQQGPPDVRPSAPAPPPVPVSPVSVAFRTASPYGEDMDTPPTSPTSVLFVEAPPRSPARMSTSQESPRSSRILPKRSMPELDGVWKGFLEEVEEDATSLISAHDQRPVIHRSRSGSLSRPHGQSISKQLRAELPPSPRPSPRLDRQQLLPPSSPSHTRFSSPTKELLSGSPSPSPSRMRPRISTSSSSDSASSLAYLARSSPLLPSPLETDESSDDDPSWASDDMAQRIHSSLAKFPKPPPLTVRHASSTSSFASHLPSLPVTPDTTPCVTPTKHRFTITPPPLIRNTSSPTSILKKPSNGPRLSPLPTPPITPDIYSPVFPPDHCMSKPPTRHKASSRTSSASNIRTCKSTASLHRPTSSEGSSAKSPKHHDDNIRQHGPGRSRPEPRSPLKTEFYSAESYHHSQSSRPATPAREIQWGYAL